MEHKGVVLITVLPVIAGLVLNEVLAATSGYMHLAALAPVWCLQSLLTALLTALLLASYFLVSSLPSRRRGMGTPGA